MWLLGVYSKDEIDYHLGMGEADSMEENYDIEYKDHTYINGKKWLKFTCEGGVWNGAYVTVYYTMPAEVFDELFEADDFNSYKDIDCIFDHGDFKPIGYDYRD